MSLLQATSTAFFEVVLDNEPGSKFERERRAFHRLLPELLTSHRGQYVAIHNEQVADAGPRRLDVALGVLQRVGNVDIYVGLVTDQEQPVYRSGVRRDLSVQSRRQ
jgi:hypothetical protein